ncbi:MAG: Gfo/Idh/MocA family oxidoreductase [Actinomycetia bacterium]|nr:Gfo/Idh/MocA family oxidoreductase [Actinomycetes bacterium]
MDTLKIGVMGCANIAYRSMIPAILSIPQWELVAVASRSITKAVKFADIFSCQAVEGYKNLLAQDDIDAIYMPLPTGLHGEWIPKCLDAGKHVFAEKSLARNFAEAKSMVKQAEASDLLIMENYMFQHHSQHRFVKDMLDNGEIGDIRLFRSCFGFPPLPENNFRYNKDLGGGALLDAGGYPVKAAQLFLGNNLKVKAADLWFCEDRGIDIHGSAYLSSQEGSVAEIAFGFDNYYQCNYEFWGSKGKIVAERAFTPSSSFRPTIILEKQNIVTRFQVEPDNHFINILKEFYRAILENRHEKHHQEVLNQARLLEAIHVNSTQ